MDFLKKLLGTVQGVLGSAGAVVDAAVPVAQGDRTKISALVAVLGPFLCATLTPVFPAACPVVQALSGAAAALLPAFALAGLVRK